MTWGLFGPIEFRTKRGNRVIFVAGFITLPLSAYSIWRLVSQNEDSKPPLGSTGKSNVIDLNKIE